MPGNRRPIFVKAPLVRAVNIVDVEDEIEIYQCTNAYGARIDKITITRRDYPLPNPSDANIILLKIGPSGSNYKNWKEVRLGYQSNDVTPGTLSSTITVEPYSYEPLIVLPYNGIILCEVLGRLDNGPNASTVDLIVQGGIF